MVIFLACNIILTVFQAASSVFLVIVVLLLRFFVSHVETSCRFDSSRGTCVCYNSGNKYDLEGMAICIFLL